MQEAEDLVVKHFCKALNIKQFVFKEGFNE
jgi:hypothetical protein